MNRISTYRSIQSSLGIAITLMAAACAPASLPAATITPPPTAPPSSTPEPTATYQPTETIAPTESNESTANSFINADIVVVLPAGNPNRGEQRSRRLGCYGCHANYPDKIPPFNSTADLPRIDERGELRIADPNYAGNATNNQEYFIESIIFPGLYLAPGEYTRSMPTYLEEQIAEQDVADILAWLATLD